MMSSKVSHALRTSLHIFGGPIFRFACMLLLLILSGYLAYQHAYAPLFDEVQLPEGLQEPAARIDVNILDSVIQVSLQKSSHIPARYEQYRQLFNEVPR